jgi:serine/threonine-protein kinase
MNGEDTKSRDDSSSSESRYRRAKAIAMDALERPFGERSTWAREQCGDDPSLWPEVEWMMLAAEDDSDDELPEQFQAAAREVVREVSLKIPLPRDYRLIQRLNDGGSGTVYLAERIDGDLRQSVALKLLQLTAAPDATLARRFATERQILSRLNHPNIAHLIDGGLTAEGRPFLATEFVDGQPIDEWCRNRELDIEARIVLFQSVLAAVDYAHRHMVIHRDLKPGNILVSREGEVKLLDFGIARLLDEPEGKAGLTDTADPGMTLIYASPEQIEGDGLTSATDVYSLGVILYELITGRRPFDHLDSAHLLPQAILDGQIDAPSRQAGVAIPSSMRSDLDAIILKALRREPADRYPSIREFSADLDRLLAHQPIAARRGHLLYRAQRFGRRHRLGMVIALAGLTLIVTFMLDREAQLKRIAWERDRAEAVTEFMNELFAGADSLPSRGNEVTVREILDLGADQLQANGTVNPAFTGSIHLALGSAYNALGLGEQALPLLTQADQSLSPESTTLELAVIQAQMAAALDSAGRATDAIEADQRAINLYQQAEGNHETAILRLRIRQLRNHANVLDIPLDRTIDELRSIVERLQTQPVDRGELLFDAQAALVGAYVIEGNAERAIDTATAARDLASRLWDADDPRELRGRFVYATAVMLNDPEAAVDVYTRLVADHERLIGPGQRLANTIGNLGVALSRVGATRESMAAFERASQMIETVADRDHYLYRLSISNLAALHLRDDNPAQAERLISEILDDLAERARQEGGVELAYYASALDILGTALSLQQRYEEAADIYRRALTVLSPDDVGSRDSLRSAIQQRLTEVERRLDS